MLQQCGVAVIQFLQCFGGAVNLSHQSIIILRGAGSAAPAWACPGRWPIWRGAANACWLAMLSSSERREFCGDGLHGAIQLRRHGTQKLEILRELAVPVLNARRSHSSQFP